MSLPVFATVCTFFFADPGPLLLVDDSRLPQATIAWTQRTGKELALTMDRPYTAPEQRGDLGHNLECFIAMGGTRLDAGVGHPSGAIVRVGFYKTVNARPFFEQLADGSDIHIRLEGVYFNQPIAPRPETILQHIKYTTEDLAACGLGGESINLYNTASKTDTLAGKIVPDSARMGIVNSDQPGAAKVDVRVEADGSLSLDATFPYALLRHVKDPWLRTAPGSFQEPTHFHIEVEVLPEEVAKSLEPAEAVGE